MKRYLVILILALFTKAMQSQSISQIETTKSWYHVYDETGKLVKTISISWGELMGNSASFFILKKGSYYMTYDIKGMRLHTFPVYEVGEIMIVIGETFTSCRGSWIYTWSKEGRKIKTRAVR